MGELIDLYPGLGSYGVQGEDHVVIIISRDIDLCFYNHGEIQKFKDSYGTRVKLGYAWVN